MFFRITGLGTQIFEIVIIVVKKMEHGSVLFQVIINWSIRHGQWAPRSLPSVRTFYRRVHNLLKARTSVIEAW